MKTAIVIGAGIVGLATARALAMNNFRVKVIERNKKAVGASIRNFGMVWPIGQPDGELYNTAIQSKRIWVETCAAAGVDYDLAGSLHIANEQDEWNVLQELESKYQHRGYSLLNKEQTLNASPAIVPDNLVGSLYSPTEMIVDPRQAIAKISEWLAEKYFVEFIYGKAVTDVSYPAVYAGPEQWEADMIYVTTGADFETLYPHIFQSSHLTKCKLQMMRMGVQPDNWRIGPAICGALSLIHYTGFTVADSLYQLRKRFEADYPEYIRWGIHVMAAQNVTGEITVGDSHEYALVHDPFDKAFINKLVLDYLKKFVKFKNETIIESWHGIYAKLTNGKSYLVAQPEPGVCIINGLGGAGMTLSFGLCDHLVTSQHSITV